MDKLDEALQHYGIKGMRWGVSRTKSQIRASKMSKKEKAALDKYHESRKNKTSYQKAYKNQFKKTKNHYEAVKQVSKHQTVKTVMGARAAIMMSPLLLDQGAKIYRGIKHATMNPDNIRKGKNVIQAIKRSPIRYVDGSKMKNVVN